MTLGPVGPTEAAIEGRILAIGPSRGGVADAFRRSVLELRGRGKDVMVVDLPIGRVPALSAIGRVLAASREIRRAAVIHVEFGSNDTEVFWFGFAAVLIRPDCVVVVHDYPKFAHVPSAALVPASSRWLQGLVHRVISPAIDGLLVRTVMRRSGVLVVFGEEARRAWLEQGASRVEVVRHGGEVLAEEHVVPPSQGETIVLAGFLGPHKGVDTLLNAWQRINAYVDLTLTIGGVAEPPDDVWMVELERRSAGLPNPPRFLGRVAEERDFQRLLGRAAIVVLPYRRSSPASGVLVRAMLAGRAVISTPTPAASAVIVDHENGILVPINDAEALADAILSLVRSPQERDRLGAAAARTARELFTWSGHVDGLERAYRAARSPQDES
jgi:glycosyltransferase involved in cell wall biosynthesis